MVGSMSFQAQLADADTFVSGWGPVEDIDGLRFRWIQGAGATIAITAAVPWNRLRLHCRFVDTIRQDVAITVRSGVGEASCGSGVLWWKGVGMQHRRVELDTTVASGTALIEFEPVEMCDEAFGGRSLSVAVSSLRGDHRTHRNR